MTSEKKTLSVILVTVLTGWIGFSLPFPIFSHIFLNDDYGVVDGSMSVQLRTFFLGCAMAIYPVGQIIGSPYLGRWADRYGRKPVLQYSLVATVVGAIVLAIGITTGSLVLIFLGRFLSGLSEGNLAIAQTIVADISTPESKARNFAYIGIAIDSGFIIGPILGGVLADKDILPWFNAALPFWVAVILFLLNFLVVRAFLIIPKTNKVQEPLGQSFHKTLFRPKMFRIFALSFTIFWVIMIFFEFFAVYFVQLFKTPPAELGVYAALISVPLIISGLFVNRIIKKFGNRITAILSTLLMGGGIVLFIQPDNLLELVFPIILICIGINFGQTATSVLISDEADEGEQGQAMGVYRAVTVAAGGLSALVAGSLAGYSPVYPFYTAIGAAVFSLFILLPMRHEVTRQT